jgi:hypothetical protein
VSIKNKKYLRCWEHLLEEIPFLKLSFLGFENKLKYFIKCLPGKCLENFCHNILTICFLKINDMKTDPALLINKLN